ncbi:MAG: hydrogenase maturation protease [Colwellia sp.]|nr:hydrogenase maturation protease [Colwellia sp.]
MENHNVPTAPYKVAVLCYGNPSRGDDALAPLAYDQLIELCDERNDVLLVNDFQLQIEHIVDLQQAELVLFIDAHVNCNAPFEFSQLEISKQLAHTSHALSPSDLLGFYQQSLNVAPPPAFVLAVKGESFELGEKLSDTAKDNLAQSVVFAQQLLNNVQLSSWLSLVKTELIPFI